MIPRILCRLVGGQFDGDEGSLELPLPPRIFAAACIATICDPEYAMCPVGGVHWFWEPVVRPTVRYDRAEFADGCQVYRLAGDPTGDEAAAHDEQLVPA